MSSATVYNYTTGPATLPIVGSLSYNGVTFGPLFESSVSGEAIKDNAQRTVKYMSYTITVDGYVTLPVGSDTIAGPIETLRTLLTQQGGALVYQGRGMDLTINPQGAGGLRDVAWGPAPELLEFQPLGAGRSAKVRWRVKVCITKVHDVSELRADQRGRITSGLALQFNYDTGVEYNEDGYSTLHTKGTLEVPMSRTPTQSTRNLTYTVDAFRNRLERQILDGIDLTRFRVVHRKFDVSRDKRTLEWELTAEEKPYMDLPPDCTIARGTYSVKPAKTGPGLVRWLCTLRGTYIVRADRPRRTAWFAYLALLRLRMSQSVLGQIPELHNGNQNPNRVFLSPGPPEASPRYGARFWADQMEGHNRLVTQSQNAWLIDFSFEEGLYLDSKSITFSATWTLVTTFNHILMASGLWKKLPEKDEQGTNVWATSMRDVSKSQSWLPNRLDPRYDIIVDFGGP